MLGTVRTFRGIYYVYKRINILEACTRTAENLDRAAIIDLQEELAKSKLVAIKVWQNYMRSREI